jgi:hypothetical protein
LYDFLQLFSPHPRNQDVENDQHDPAAVKNLVWKQDLRIIPLSAFIYLLCYLDRSNIGIDLFHAASI